jgi:hypothetical protein
MMIPSPSSKLSDCWIPFEKTTTRLRLAKKKLEKRWHSSKRTTITIHCQGGYYLTLSQWLSQDSRNSSALCESTFDSSTMEEEQKVVVNLEKPVQVFIMLGGESKSKEYAWQ